MNSINYIQIAFGTIFTLLMGWGVNTLNSVDKQAVEFNTRLASIEKRIDDSRIGTKDLQLRLRVVENEIAVLKLKTRDK